MYAIVEIAGQQFKVEKGSELLVNRLPEEEGSKINFDKVLLVDNNGEIAIGNPTVSGAMVKGEVLEHGKGETVIVFKKKRRKGYQVRNGHRQYLSKIKISDISGVKTAKNKKESNAATSKEATTSTEEKTATTKKENDKA